MPTALLATPSILLAQFVSLAFILFVALALKLALGAPERSMHSFWYVASSASCFTGSEVQADDTSTIVIHDCGYRVSIHCLPEAPSFLVELSGTGRVVRNCFLTRSPLFCLPKIAPHYTTKRVRILISDVRVRCTGTCLSDFQELGSLLIGQRAKQLDVALDAASILARVAFGAIGGVNLRVAQTHRDTVERPLLAAVHTSTPSTMCNTRAR